MKRGSGVALGLALLSASLVWADGVPRGEGPRLMPMPKERVIEKAPRLLETIDVQRSSVPCDHCGTRIDRTTRAGRSVLPYREDTTTKVMGASPLAIEAETPIALDVRQGGDTCETAFIISGLPFTDAGTTVGYADDFSERCLRPVFTEAGDVVYEFTPTADTNVSISLCNSATNFENAIFVYEGGCASTDLLACNEDVCATDSLPYGGAARIECLFLSGGTTYYIVIDGTMGDEGDYVLEMAKCTPCPLECDPESTLEGEPTCYSGYVDTFNRGCLDGQKYFTPISCGETVCGTSGVFYGETGFRYDTDYYELVLAEDAELTLTLESQFAVVFYVIANAGMDDCSLYDWVRTAMLNDGDCAPISLTYCVPAGVHWFAVQARDPDVSCGRTYQFSVACSPCTAPRGSCCLEDGTCVEDVTALACDEYYKSPMFNEGQDCASVTCPVRENAPTCDQAIELAVPSSAWATTEGGAEVSYPNCSWPTEDLDVGTWYKVIGTGNRITATTCNDMGFGDVATMTVYCGGCASPMCAADYNDGGPCAGSTSFGNTVSWCSQPGYEYYIWLHSWTAAYDPYDMLITVYDDGTPCADYPLCDPPVGVCCLDDFCYGDGMELGDCEAIGGRFFKGKECATFTCPDECRGDTVQTAIEIDALPYHTEGNTLGCFDDYLQMCMYDYWSANNNAADVVYVFNPTQDVVVDLSLCRNSKLNTKLSVFQDDFTPQSNPFTALACSVDSCSSPSWHEEGTVSRIDCLEMFAGSTYYVLVDGGVYSHRGYYTFDVTEAACAAGPCDIACSPGATPEGEPVIVDDYDDTYNGGCNSTPASFSSISCGETVCGVSGTYSINGQPGYRDTDWYAISVTEDTEFVVTFTPEFDGFVGFVDNNGIANCATATEYIFAGVVTEACETANFTLTLPPGEWWLVAAPMVFEGLTSPVQYELTLNCSAAATADGACCSGNGICTIVDANACFDLGGTFQGAGTTCDPNPCPTIPENDDCANATYISVPSETIGSTILATPDQLSSEGSQLGVWYKFIGTGNGVELSTCNDVTDFDTSIDVYCLGCDREEWSYVRPMFIEERPGEETILFLRNAPTFRADDDWICRDNWLASTFGLCTERGAEYFVFVYGHFGATGNFRLDVVDSGSPCLDEVNGSCAATPVNDGCADAEPIGEVTDLFWNTSFATNNGGAAGPDIWYCYTATCTDRVTVSWEQEPSLTFDSTVAVYSGCSCGPFGTLLVSHVAGESRSLTFNAVAGLSYLIVVGDRTGVGGAGWLSVQCTPPVVGACCTAEAPYCTEVFESECVGTFLGEGTVCDLNDCNSNGVPDSCDIATGNSRDCNGNGVPDECELCGDLDGNGSVDYDDYVIFLSAFGGAADGSPVEDYCCDYDGSGAVGLADYNAWLAGYRDFIGDQFAGPPSAPEATQPGLTSQGGVKKKQKLPAGATLKGLR